VLLRGRRHGDHLRLRHRAFYPKPRESNDLPITGTLATAILVLGTGREAHPRCRRQPGGLSRITTWLTLIASALYLIPQVFGVEAADQAYLAESQPS